MGSGNKTVLVMPMANDSHPRIWTYPASPRRTTKGEEREVGEVKESVIKEGGAIGYHSVLTKFGPLPSSVSLRRRYIAPIFVLFVQVNSDVG